MKNTNISECANPQCNEEFKRLGEGKLYVRPADKSIQGTSQTAVWLCPNCSEQFDLRYDRRQQEYNLVRRRRVA
jgi:hypothetical protein